MVACAPHIVTTKYVQAKRVNAINLITTDEGNTSQGPHAICLPVIQTYDHELITVDRQSLESRMKHTASSKSD